MSVWTTQALVDFFISIKLPEFPCKFTTVNKILPGIERFEENISYKKLYFILINKDFERLKTLPRNVVFHLGLLHRAQHSWNFLVYHQLSQPT